MPHLLGDTYELLDRRLPAVRRRVLSFFCGRNSNRPEGRFFLPRNKMDQLSTWLGTVTLVVLVWQVTVLRKQLGVQERALRLDQQRRRAQETVNAIAVLRSNSMDVAERAIRVKVDGHTNWRSIDPDFKGELRLILSYFERFAVTVNTEVYDLAIVNRTIGAYLIGVWDAYCPYVTTVRGPVGSLEQNYYREFENLVKAIQVARKSKPIDTANGGELERT